MMCSTPPSYNGTCDNCKGPLGEKVGAIMGPCTYDETDDRLYEFCCSCYKEWEDLATNAVSKVTLKFLRKRKKRE